MLHLYLLDKSRTGLFFGVFGFVRRYRVMTFPIVGVFLGAGCTASGNVVEGEGADGSGDGPRVGRAREGHWGALGRLYTGLQRAPLRDWGGSRASD